MAFTFLSAVAFIGGVVLFFGAAIIASVFLRILWRGRVAAREAFEHGDSLKNWWRAQAPDGFNPHGLRARCSLAGRYHKDLGVVAVEERASQPSYLR